MPLNVMCSMKWATPTWPGASRRDPARTYAAIETERAAGSRALITRGPAGSAVRSNIAGDGTGTGRRPGWERLPVNAPADAVQRQTRGAYLMKVGIHVASTDGIETSDIGPATTATIGTRARRARLSAVLSSAVGSPPSTWT